MSLILTWQHENRRPLLLTSSYFTRQPRCVEDADADTVLNFTFAVSIHVSWAWNAIKYVSLGTWQLPKLTWSLAGEVIPRHKGVIVRAALLGDTLMTKLRVGIDCMMNSKVVITHAPALKKQGDSDTHLLRCSNTASAPFSGVKHPFKDSALPVRIQCSTSLTSVPHTLTWFVILFFFWLGPFIWTDLLGALRHQVDA